MRPYKGPFDLPQLTHLRCHNPKRRLHNTQCYVICGLCNILIHIVVAAYDEHTHDSLPELQELEQKQNPSTQMVRDRYRLCPPASLHRAHVFAVLQQEGLSDAAAGPQ